MLLYTQSQDLIKICINLVIATLLNLAVLSDVIGDSTSGGYEGPAPKDNRVDRLSKYPVVIVISFDGFRHNYFGRGVKTPNMDIIRDTGVSAKYMRSQFITKTFPNHQSIATGLYEESHGIVDNSVFDPQFERVLRNLDSEFWNFNNLTMPLWTLNELVGNGRRSGSMMWPGAHIPFGVQGTMPSKIVMYKEGYPYENEVDNVIDWITDATNPLNLAFLYFDQPDGIAHAFGPESPEVTKVLSVVDKTVGYLMKKLQKFGIYDKVNLIFVSDHGFQEVKQSDIINITSVLQPGTFKVFGSSPVLQILPNERYQDQVYSTLKEFSLQKNFTVFKKYDLHPIWHYRDNRRVMPLVLVADLGFVFDDFQSGSIDFYNEKFHLTPNPSRVYGAHGYDNGLSQMFGFFMANGPAFKSGYQVDHFDNVDLYPLICGILGLQPPPNNGSLSVVSHLLRDNRPVYWTSQTK